MDSNNQGACVLSSLYNLVINYLPSGPDIAREGVTV